jgi:hypothetical protein
MRCGGFVAKARKYHQPSLGWSSRIPSEIVIIVLAFSTLPVLCLDPLFDQLRTVEYYARTRLTGIEEAKGKTKTLRI